MAKRNSNIILSNMNVVLHNVYVLYFILLVALADLFYLVSSANYVYSAIFILTGFITSFFSKNMMVILCIALVVTNVLKQGTATATATATASSAPTLPKEGFSNDEEDDEDEDKKNEKMSNIKENYQELKELQNQIMGGMEQLNEPLTKAENILEKLAKEMNVHV